MFVLAFSAIFIGAAQANTLTTPTISPSTVYVGNTMTLRETVSGSNTPYDYSLLNATGVGGPCSVSDYSMYVGGVQLTSGGTSSTSWSFNVPANNAGTFSYCFEVSGGYFGGGNYEDDFSNIVSVTIHNVPVPLTSGAPTPANSVILSGQGVTLTAHISGGTGSYPTIHWYRATSAGTCSTSDALWSVNNNNAYSIPGSDMSESFSPYYFCYIATDSGTNTTYSPTAEVAVNYPLGTPGTPTPSMTALYTGQSLTISAGIGGVTGTGVPPVSYELLANGGSGYAYVSGAACTAGGSTVSCGPYTPAAGAYTYEVEAVDSNSPAETTTSGASSLVNVYSGNALAAGAPTPEGVSIDWDQGLTLYANVSGGTSPYSIEWYSSWSPPGCSGYDLSISGNTANINPNKFAYGGDTVYLCYVVQDSRGIVVDSPVDPTGLSSPLGAPGAATPSANSLVFGNSLTVSASTSGVAGTGTDPITYALYDNPGTGYDALGTTCSPSGSTVTCGPFIPAGGTHTYEIWATDSATSPEISAGGASPQVDVSVPSTTTSTTTSTTSTTSSTSSTTSTTSTTSSTSSTTVTTTSTSTTSTTSSTSSTTSTTSTTSSTSSTTVTTTSTSTTSSTSTSTTTSSTSTTAPTTTMGFQIFGSGGSGVGTGGGTFAPTMVSYTVNNRTGYTILNFSLLNTVTFKINGKAFTVTLNALTPNSTDVTVNGQQVILVPGVPYALEDPPSYVYYAELGSISYLPIGHTAVLSVYGQPASAPATNQTNTTTNNTRPTAPSTTVATTIVTTVATTATTTMPATVPPVQNIDANAQQPNSASWATVAAVACLVLVAALAGYALLRGVKVGKHKH